MGLPQPKPGTGLMTIAFDLDGTLAEPTWPKPYVGKPIQKAVDALIAYHDQGYEIIIFTSRPASHLGIIASWLADNGLDEIVYDIVTDKPRAAAYIDDRAIAFPEAFEDEVEKPHHLRDCPGYCWQHLTTDDVFSRVDKASQGEASRESEAALTQVREDMNRLTFFDSHPKDTDPRAHYYHQDVGVHHYSRDCGRFACERMPE